MLFREWLLLNENVEENFDNWLELLFKYTKRNTEAGGILSLSPGFDRLYIPAPENFLGIDPKTWDDDKKNVIKDLIQPSKKNFIKQVLKEKNIENFNWFSFCIGYLSAKRDFLKEDLELAIEVTRRRISSGELPKPEIGNKGWLVIGYESEEHVREYLDIQGRISNRQLEKMKKSGKSLDEDPNLIKLLIEENDIKVYFLPALDEKLITSVVGFRTKDETVKKRHLLLCKYGRGTKWCTASPSWDAHAYYIYNNILIVHSKDKPVYQFVSCKDQKNTQFKDVEDREVHNLDGEMYDFLNKNLKQDISCYKITRDITLKELMNDDEEVLNQKLESGITEKRALSLLKLTSTNEQSIKLIKRILKYKIIPSYGNYNITSILVEGILKKVQTNDDKQKIFEILNKTTINTINPEAWAGFGESEENCIKILEYLIQNYTKGGVDGLTGASWLNTGDIFRFLIQKLDKKMIEILLNQDDSKLKYIYGNINREKIYILIKRSIKKQCIRIFEDLLKYKESFFLNQAKEGVRSQVADIIKLISEEKIGKIKFLKILGNKSNAFVFECLFSVEINRILSDRNRSDKLKESLAKKLFDEIKLAFEINPDLNIGQERCSNIKYIFNKYSVENKEELEKMLNIFRCTVMIKDD